MVPAGHGARGVTGEASPAVSVWSIGGHSLCRDLQVCAGPALPSLTWWPLGPQPRCPPDSRHRDQQQWAGGENCAPTPGPCLSFPHHTRPPRPPPEVLPARSGFEPLAPWVHGAQPLPSPRRAAPASSPQKGRPRLRLEATARSLASWAGEGRPSGSPAWVLSGTAGPLGDAVVRQDTWVCSLDVKQEKLGNAGCRQMGVAHACTRGPRYRALPRDRCASTPGGSPGTQPSGRMDTRPPQQHTGGHVWEVLGLPEPRFPGTGDEGGLCLCGCPQGPGWGGRRADQRRRLWGKPFEKLL